MLILLINLINTRVLYTCGSLKWKEIRQDVTVRHYDGFREMIGANYCV